MAPLEPSAAFVARLSARHAAPGSPPPVHKVYHRPASGRSTQCGPAGGARRRGGRFGAHNQHPNFPGSTSAHLRNTFVGSFFNGGVRIYRLFDVPVRNAPPVVKEIGFFIPAAPPGNPTGTIQINHMIVDENRLIYANDRATGGLYILRYTGPDPLD